MKYFKDDTGTVHGYDETISAWQPYIDQAVASGWQDITGSWPPPETETSTQARLSDVLGSAINDAAAQWGYNSIISAVSYVTSENPQYVAEARALSIWRDQVWAWAIPALAAAQPGELPGQFLAGMPDFPPRPVI